jgi:hypothetical protein
MKILRALFALIFVAGILSFSSLNDPRFIEWKQDHKLMWSDFMGNFDSKLFSTGTRSSDRIVQQGDSTFTYHTEMDAYCYHQISFNSNYFGDTIAFDVKTLFDRTKSWTQTNSTYILNHEQRHFDLAELHARKFRKYLMDSVHSFDPKKMQSDFQRYSNIMEQDENNYDALTQHSIDVNEQERFNQSIDSGLNALAAYSNTHITVYVPQHRVRGNRR